MVTDKFNAIEIVQELLTAMNDQIEERKLDIGVSGGDFDFCCDRNRAQ